MQNLKKGDVIRNTRTDQKVRVSEVIRNPKYDVDGVPCSVQGHFVDDGVHIAITFGGISPSQPVANWLEWMVTERS